MIGIEPANITQETWILPTPYQTFTLLSNYYRRFKKLYQKIGSEYLTNELVK